MLYNVRMDVRVPTDGDPAVFERLKAAEKQRAQELQRSGKLLHLWRVAGEYANISIFDVADHDELHGISIGDWLTCEKIGQYASPDVASEYFLPSDTKHAESRGRAWSGDRYLRRTFGV